MYGGVASIIVNPGTRWNRLIFMHQLQYAIIIIIIIIIIISKKRIFQSSSMFIKYPVLCRSTLAATDITFSYRLIERLVFN